jgi:hypothetical protein
MVCLRNICINTLHKGDDDDDDDDDNNNNMTFLSMTPCSLVDRRQMLKCWRNLLSPCSGLKTLKVSMPQIELKPLILWLSGSLLVHIQNSLFQFLAWTLTVLTEIFVDFINICRQVRVLYLTFDH